MFLKTDSEKKIKGHPNRQKNIIKLIKWRPCVQWGVKANFLWYCESRSRLWAKFWAVQRRGPAEGPRRVGPLLTQTTFGPDRFLAVSGAAWRVSGPRRVFSGSRSEGCFSWGGRGAKGVFWERGGAKGVLWELSEGCFLGRERGGKGVLGRGGGAKGVFWGTGGTKGVFWRAPEAKGVFWRAPEAKGVFWEASEAKGGEGFRSEGCFLGGPREGCFLGEAQKRRVFSGGGPRGGCFPQKRRVFSGGGPRSEGCFLERREPEAKGVFWRRRSPKRRVFSGRVPKGVFWRRPRRVFSGRREESEGCFLGGARRVFSGGARRVFWGPEGPRRVFLGAPKGVFGRPRRVGVRERREGARRVVGARKGGGRSEGWCGAPKGGGGAPKWETLMISCFFALSHHYFHSVPLLGVVSWNFGGVLKVGTLKCARLEFSCYRVKPRRPGCRWKGSSVGAKSWMHPQKSWTHTAPTHHTNVVWRKSGAGQKWSEKQKIPKIKNPQ